MIELVKITKGTIRVISYLYRLYLMESMTLYRLYLMLSMTKPN